MKTTTQNLTVPIYGLSCGGGGALAVERALVHTAGVIRAYVNPLTEMAYVEFDPLRSDVETILKAIDHTGLRAGQASYR